MREHPREIYSSVRSRTRGWDLTSALALALVALTIAIIAVTLLTFL
jgi:hypothetical protein